MSRLRHSKGSLGGKGGQFKSKTRPDEPTGQDMGLDTADKAVVKIAGKQRTIKQRDGMWTNSTVLNSPFARKLPHRLEQTRDDAINITTQIITDMLNDGDMNTNPRLLKPASEVAIHTIYGGTMTPNITVYNAYWPINLSACLRAYRYAQQYDSPGARNAYINAVGLITSPAQKLFSPTQEDDPPYLGEDGKLLERLFSPRGGGYALVDYCMDYDYAELRREEKPTSVFWIALHVWLNADDNTQIKHDVELLLKRYTQKDDLEEYSGWSELARLALREYHNPTGNTAIFDTLQAINDSHIDIQYWADGDNLAYSTSAL